MKALLVDDEPSVLKQAKIFLEKENEEMEIETAISVKKGLEALQKKNIDVIVSDYEMPKKNGIEFLKIIREDKNLKIPFIMLTGKGREEVAMKALNLGADKYLQKIKNPKKQYKILAKAILESKKQKEIEDKLEEIKERYRNLIESQNDFIIRTNTEDKISFVNDAYCNFLGKNENEILNEKITSLVNEEFKEKIDEIKKSHETTNLEIKIQGINESRWIQWKISPILKDGEIEEVQSVGRDITHSIEREKDLKRYKTMVEEANDDIQIIDLEGNIRFLNKKSRKFLEPENENILGENIFEFAHPDDREELIEEFEKFLHSDKKEPKGEIEARWKGSDGSYSWFESKGQFIEDKEKILIVSRNIEKRKKREEELKRKEFYLDYIPEFIQVINEDMEIIYRNKNPFSKETLEKEEIEGAKLVEFVHPEDEDTIAKTYDKALQNPGKKFKNTLRGRTEEGWRWYEGTIINYLNDPKIEGIIITGQDITERKKAEEREEFLHSILRHDIRNKTQIIQSYQSMLKDYDLPEEAEEYLENANKAAENNIELIEKIRTLRELNEEEEIKTIEIGSRIKKSISKEITDHLRGNLDIEIEDMKREIRAGPLVERIFINLVENAITHGDCEKIKVSGTEKGEEFIVSVEDNGKGIPDDKKEKIFERSYKTGETSGTGLGLYLSKEIAENYGGKIEAGDSELGGAKFDVHFKKK